MMLKKVLRLFFPEIDLKGVILIATGSLTLILTMVKSGLVYPYGMGFWGANGHDGVWHIALIRSLARGSWEMPVMAGEQLKNYHVGYDLLLAFLHKVTFIPAHVLYFQVLPIILAFAVGFTAYKFVLYWTGSNKQAFWATFFLYFGGSWGWLVNLIRNGNIDGESMFWAQQSVTTLINPPFALSLVLLFVGLTFLLKGLRHGKNSMLLAATFIFGILVQIKVYAGLTVLAGLFSAGIIQLLKRKGTKVFKVFAGALIVSVLVFSPFDGGGSLVELRPLFFLDSMMANIDRLNWPRFAEALLNYNLAGNWPKLMIAYTVAGFIFLLGNMGSRIIFLPEMVKQFKNYKKISLTSVIINVMIIVGFTIPFVFVQSGTAWNTIQFMYYSLVLTGVIAGISFSHILSNTNVKVLRGTIALAVIFLTVSTTAGSLYYHYLPGRPPAKISNEELEALRFLEKQPNGVVLTQPFDADAAQKAIKHPPRPLYNYESTAYVSAFSDKPVYLEDEVNLEITGFNWRERRDEILYFYANLENIEVKQFLQERNIKYLYNLRNDLEIIDGKSGLHKIFENSLVQIFKVN